MWFVDYLTRRIEDLMMTSPYNVAQSYNFLLRGAMNELYDKASFWLHSSTGAACCRKTFQAFASSPALDQLV